MSEDNTLAQVVAGTAPQPYEKQENSYDDLQDDAESAVDSGLEADASPEEKITQAAADGKITQAQAAQLKKTLKIKVDGQELEETVDFNDEEGLKRTLQKSRAFDKRNNEFAQYRSQTEKLLEMLEKDPEGLMEKLGFDLDGFAEKRLSKRVEELKKSPEQVDREKMEKELQDLREEKKRIQEEQQKSQMEKMRNESAQQIESEIADALGAVSSILPKKNPIVLQRIAQTMLTAMKNGYPEVTAKDVIPLVEKQWKQELNDLFSVLPEDTMEMLVGKPNLERHRKKYLASKRAGTQTATPKQLVKDTGIKADIPNDDNNPKSKEKFKKFFTFD